MELMFNELSSVPESRDTYHADRKIVALLNCFKAAGIHGFSGIRFPVQFHEISLAAGFTIVDWIQQTDRRDLKNLLLAIRRYPFIREGDETSEDAFLKHSFTFRNQVLFEHPVACYGLAAAWLYDTLSICLSGSDFWEANQIPVLKTEEESGYQEVINIVNVFSEKCFYQEVVQSQVERISELRLIPSRIAPENKQINLRDDHGKDVLHHFSLRLRNNEYVDRIINSLPFNPSSKCFIRRVWPDGRIEIVLTWTDQGLGLVIQSTGQNLRQTRAIAEILAQQFANG